MFPNLRSAALVVMLSLTGTALLLPSIVRADDHLSVAASATNHSDAIKTPAGKFIQDVGDEAIAAIADKSMTKDKRSEKFRGILRNSFDLKTIGRFVIGRTWNAATPEQQQEYMSLFEDLVIKTYGDRMALYTGEGFTVVGVRPESEKDTIVNSLITHPDNSPPATLDWRVRLRDGKLGIIDVVVEGVSLSVTQRQEYSSVIQNNGGEIGPLLDKMRQQLQAADSQG